MKTKLILGCLLAFVSVHVQAQWAQSCTGTDLINTNTSTRVGIGSCPGNGTYTQYDQLTLGGLGRIKFHGTSPTNTWYGGGGAVMGMDPDSLFIVVGGVNGMTINGDINGLDANGIWLKPTGKIGIGTSSPAEKLSVHGNAAPDGDNIYNCGTSANRWKQIWSATGTIQTSDIRYKTNINNLKYGLQDVLKLRPVSYNWKKGDDGTHLGIIAQELKEVIKEVVYEGTDVNKNLGVAYSDLIPVLIKAIQEQQQQISELQQKNTSSTGINQLNNSKEGFYMDQNNPNPFTHETMIKYTLPQQINSAFMAVYDLTGKQIASFPLTEKGSSSITITSEKLAAGIYIYSIVADGKIMDSKRMVVAEKN